ncbi:UNVERIFIED_CONTAM: hypothetical protein K2H54_026377 [Gekko kuhli]
MASTRQHPPFFLLHWAGAGLLPSQPSNFHPLLSLDSVAFFALPPPVQSGWPSEEQFGQTGLGEGGISGVCGATSGSTDLSRRPVMAASSDESVEKELAELKSRLEQKSLKNVFDGINQELSLLKNTTLNIAVTGNMGAGKSSFVNAFRNISDYTQGSAETGVKQTTMEPHKYRNDIFPEITLWDLPGIGTHGFKPNDYLKIVHFSMYDFFIIVSSGCFTVNDAILALEIKKMNKQFYFVRTKMDQDMDNEKRKSNFNEAQTLEQIRNDYLSKLMKEGIDNPKVFLISRWHLDMYDFPKLQETLANDLNNLKRSRLIMDLLAFSRECLQKKKAVMEKLIQRRAIMSCKFRARCCRALSVCYGNDLLISTLKEICRAFGLDEDSLCNLAGRIHKPAGMLKSAVRKTPMDSQIDVKFVESILTKCWWVGFQTAPEKFCRSMPVLCPLVRGRSCYATTYSMLKGFLEDAMEDAKSVLAKAAE